MEIKKSHAARLKSTKDKAHMYNQIDQSYALP